MRKLGLNGTPTLPISSMPMLNRLSDITQMPEIKKEKNPT